ncbi:hypothetical protein BH09BAC1_BH09BAC1_12180 [soil metagenome]
MDNRNDTIAGYEPDGTPITYSKLREEIAEAEQEFEAGKGIAQDELREEVKSWRKV